MLAPASSDLESSYESRPGYHTVEVHAQAGPTQVSLHNQAVEALEAFEHLPAEEKRVFAEEVLRRSLPFDSGPLADEEITAASAALFEFLDEEDADSTAR